MSTIKLSPSERRELNQCLSSLVQPEDREIVGLFVGGLENYTFGWWGPHEREYRFFGSREMRDHIARCLPFSISGKLRNKIIRTVQTIPRTGMV